MEQKNSLINRIERLAPWFFVIVGFTYGCGFLIVFTYLKEGFGIDCSDLLRAKYIHVGVLFGMSCLVVAVPLWRLLWVVNRTRLEVWATRLQRLFLIRITVLGVLVSPLIPIYLLLKFIYDYYVTPGWLETARRLHVGGLVITSMILLLWSFLIIAIFARPNFAYIHSKLATFYFLLPMAILVLGFLGDLFNGGQLSKTRQEFLRYVTIAMRFWWVIAGSMYLYLYVETDSFEYGLWVPIWAFISFPLLLIILAFLVVFLCPWQGNRLANMLIRLAFCQWLVCMLQPAILIWQGGAFIWSMRESVLGVPLTRLLFGNNYFHLLRKNPFNGNTPFPDGAIFFVFLVTLIVFFIFQTHYHLQQLEQPRDARRKTLLLVSLIAITGPLSYIAILAFAHTIYPYIPSIKGGGDYTANPTAHVTLVIGSSDGRKASRSVPIGLLTADASSHLIILEENSEFVYFADRTDRHGPENWAWRSSVIRPIIYQVDHKLIATITYTEVKN